MAAQTVELPERVFVCGTRAVNKVSETDYRVVCATCDQGGSVRFKTKSAAKSNCVDCSGRRCPGCGAN